MKLPVQLVLVLVSAVLVPLCFPPWGWGVLVVAAYPLLLLATIHTTPRRAFYLGAVGLGLWHPAWVGPSDGEGLVVTVGQRGGLPAAPGLPGHRIQGAGTRVTPPKSTVDRAKI